MTYQVLARKWRPRVFEEIVGQAHVVTALVNALESKRLHHAYLFTGTRGVGKTTLARILAKAINCETGITPRPCGKCRACTEIDAGRFIDLLEVDAATNTKVDEMRELLDSAQYMPVAGRFKVYIIDEVHMLSRHAFNSMLKTLEEPALLQLAKAAAGSLRDSLSLLDQAIAHGGGQVKSAAVAQMLGSLGGDLVWPLLERIAQGDGKGTIAEAERIAERSVSLDTALEEIAAILHRIALAQAGAAPSEDEPDAARVLAMAQQLDAGRVQVMYQIAVLGRRDLPLAPDEFAGFSMSLLRMLSFVQPSQDSQSVRGTTAAPKVEPPRATKAAIAPAAAMKSAAPVAAATPAPATAPAPRVAFDGDWPAFVERIGLTGLAGMVARYGEFVSFQNNHLELVVPEPQKMYAEKAYLDKLKAELAPHFGQGFRLTVRVGATSGNSVAAARSREMAERQASAGKAIEDDPFVRELVRDLGAEVVTSSIKPADDSAAKPSSQER